MDPITQIVTALAAGAASGTSAAAAVIDAYALLKAPVTRRPGGRPYAELVLAKHERVPEVWPVPLMTELADAADTKRSPGSPSLVRGPGRPSPGAG